jgi:hypothetical protein
MGEKVERIMLDCNFLKVMSPVKAATYSNPSILVDIAPFSFSTGLQRNSGHTVCKVVDPSKLCVYVYPPTFVDKAIFP